MALIIEDGTGVENADSFVSVADAQTTATSYGLTLPADEIECEIALRRGYAWLDTYEARLQGRRTYETQTGVFPRSGMTANGFSIASDAITSGMIMAQISAASSIADGTETNATADSQRLASFSVDGVYSETYQSGSSASTNARIQGVENSMAPYLKSAGGITKTRDLPRWVV